MFWHVLYIASNLWRRILRSILYEVRALEGYPPGVVLNNGGGTAQVDNTERRRSRNKMVSTCRVNGEGQAVAVLTSGGDSQGMNAAIRATVRMCLYAHARCYVVLWGYEGLVTGGDNIKEFHWDDVTDIIHKGGTVIGSARCKAFRTREGRKKAALNLVKRGITNLVVIGGDGSLTGASIFREEWLSLLHELVAGGELTQELVAQHSYLNLVGMVGSIDNDFCGTDMTIGADTALHRILESADAITTTAASHQRAFILEVMGRNCGYLALMAGIATSADWVSIPEWPMKDGWQERLCAEVENSRKFGRITTMVIIAEGAQDIYGNQVTSNEVKDLLATRLNLDSRVTVFGHVQRGGTPSAFDRLLASRFGAEAALTVLEATETTVASVMCLVGSQIVKKPLNECVEQCNDIKQAYADRDLKRVIKLRGKVFESNLNIFKNLKQKHLPPLTDGSTAQVKYRFGVINVGAPAGGMNSAAASFTKKALSEGHEVVGIEDGFTGLLENKVSLLEWSQVEEWSSKGGSSLGVTRTLPSIDLELVSERFKEHKLSALFLIGGFEAFNSLVQLADARKKYDEFCIPMVLSPATMSNNVPGCWLSLGADTTLNVIVESCDRLRQSAGSSQNGVFVVETMGGKSGYLATMAGIASGADSAYIPEEDFTLETLQRNIQHLKNKLQNATARRGLILRTERCNANYTTDFISRLYQEEGKGLFLTKTCVLGHVQQGGRPSPFDRLCGTRYGIKAFEFLLDKIESSKDEFGLIDAKSEGSACVLGLIKNHSQFTPISELKEKADFVNRVPKDLWWMNIRPLLRVLANYRGSTIVREEEL